MEPEDWLLKAAKNALSYLARNAKGEYIGPNEDLHVARELQGAIAAVEDERQARELVARR